MDSRRIGLVVAGLGTLGLVRLCSEIAEAFKDGIPTLVYILLVFLDQFLAVVTIVAGVGLRKEKPWGPGLAVMVAGPLLMTSAGVGLLLLPGVFDLLGSRSGRSSALALVPRLLYYAVTLAFWPLAIRRIVREEPSEARRPLWGLFGLWLLFGGAIMGALYVGLRAVV